MIVLDNFFPQAKSLRQEFDSILDTSRSPHPKRFSWDYWHVPEQYSLLRTPAQGFFSKRLIENFQQYLLNYAKDHLGCVGITPLWLSCYIEGCKQGWHSDVPHGPFAFVFSLTPSGRRRFTGGETLILKNSTLNFWNNFIDNTKGIEEKNLMHKVQSKFNRLTVFDSRCPHSVSVVRGTNDPRQGRLVMHGWFTHPQPFVEGSLSRQQSQETIDSIYRVLIPKINSYGKFHGVLTIKLTVLANGRISGFNKLINTLRPITSASASPKFIENMVKRELKFFTFYKCKRPSKITLPLVFV